MKLNVTNRHVNSSITGNYLKPLLKYTLFSNQFLAKKKKKGGEKRKQSYSILLNRIINEKKQKKNMESFGMYKKQKAMLKEKLQSMVSCWYVATFNTGFLKLVDWNEFRSSLRLHCSERTGYVKYYRESGFGAAVIR